MVWHLLSDEQAVFTDLGADHFTRRVNSETKKRNHIRQLEAHGYTVNRQPRRLIHNDRHCARPHARRLHSGLEKRDRSEVLSQIGFGCLRRRPDLVVIPLVWVQEL